MGLQGGRGWRRRRGVRRQQWPALWPWVAHLSLFHSSQGTSPHHRWLGIPPGKQSPTGSILQMVTERLRGIQPPTLM